LTELDADELEQIRAQVRQRLESLRRGGLGAIPRPVARGEVAVAAPQVAGSRQVVEAEPTRPAPTVARPPVAAAPVAAAPVAAAVRVAGSLFEEPGAGLGEVVPVEARPEALGVLREEVAGCTRCPLLASTRTQTVFGEGSPSARLMFIGEAPGADEDLTGRPFVGKAGQLLTDMITKGMGLRREDVYIANVLKSRPPGNRDPLPEEVAHCKPYLERQIEIVRPEFLCLLGRIAAQAVLETALPLGRLRGRWHRYKGVPTLVTYHPAYLLRNPAGKKDAWADLKILMTAMGIRPPERKPGA
jgi:DNA polymerase